MNRLAPIYLTVFICCVSPVMADDDDTTDPDTTPDITMTALPVVIPAYAPVTAYLATRVSSMVNTAAIVAAGGEFHPAPNLAIAGGAVCVQGPVPIPPPADILVIPAPFWACTGGN